MISFMPIGVLATFRIQIYLISLENAETLLSMVSMNQEVLWFSKNLFVSTMNYLMKKVVTNEKYLDLSNGTKIPSFSMDST